MILLAINIEHRLADVLKVDPAAADVERAFEQPIFLKEVG